MANVTGLVEFRADIAATVARLSAELPDIVLEGAEIIQAEIKGRVHVKTGELKDGIEITSTHTPLSATSIVAPRDDLQYRAVFLEYGTSNMPAYPYMRPGFEASKDKAEQHIVNRIRGVIEQ